MSLIYFLFFILVFFIGIGIISLDKLVKSVKEIEKTIKEMNIQIKKESD